MTRIGEIITQTQQQSSISELRMVLRPATLNYRDQFRSAIDQQLAHSTRYQIPWIDRFETVDVIDNNSIIELNNTTSSERRIEFMESIRNYENINENLYYLIANNTNQVRTYLQDLLMRSTINRTINANALS